MWDLYVAHHYWDWIEDFGMQPERLTADASRLRFIRPVAAADLAVVVGEPVRVDDADVVHLRCLCR